MAPTSRSEAPAAPGSRRATAIAVAVAGSAVALFVVLAIASSLGWLPKVGGRAAGIDPDKAGALTRPGLAPPPSAVPVTNALLPGETLVAPPEPPASATPSEPLMPHYAEPKPPAAKPGR